MAINSWNSIAFAGFVACLAPLCSAADFHPINGVSSSTVGDFYPLADLIQGTGAGFNSVAPHDQGGTGRGYAWVTLARVPDWYAVEPAPVLIFDLGSDRPLNEVSTWGYADSNTNGAKDFTLRFATDTEGPDGFATSIPYSPSFEAAFPTQARDSHPFSEIVRARYVEMTITDNWRGLQGGIGGGDRVGLGEVAFEDSVPNPNPIIALASGIDFGAHPSDPGTLIIPLSISNLGTDQSLEIGPATVRPGTPGAEYFSTTGTPLTIAAGASSALSVTLDAAGNDGCFFAELELTSNDPSRPVVTIMLVASVNCTPPIPEEPLFSVDSGTFAGTFQLELNTTTPGARIVFTTDGSLPSATNGTNYSGAITIDSSRQVRAATISGNQPPAIATENYVRLAADVQAYSSALPILIVENYGAGTIPNKGWSTSTQTGAGLQQRPRQPAYMQIVNCNPITETADIGASPDLTTRIGIRVRGAFSSTWNPKPYSLETWKKDADEDRNVQPLGMPDDSDWILYYPHPSYDRTMLYNTFIWEIARETGRYGNQFRFVDVFVNENGGDLTMSDRRGVYAFAEKVKRGADRIDFEALSIDGSTGGWLLGINRMDAIPPGGFPAENLATSPQFFHTAGPDRVLQTAPNSAGQGDDIPRQYNAYINFESPNGYRINRMQRTAIENWFTEFEEVFYDDAQWRDPVNGYRKYLNTGDFIDYFHLLNLAKQGDGLLISIFPWVSSGARKLHMGPMWDFNNGAYGSNTNSPLYFRKDRLWYPRLFQDPDFQQEYIDRWYELRRGPLSTANMEALIDRQAAEITPGLAAAQGATGWSGRLDTMKANLRNRAAWLDAQFFAPPEISETDNRVTLSGSPGRIFYTKDGSDPQLEDTALLYTRPFSLNSSTMIRSRLLSDNGDWSALNESTFIIGVPADAGNLVVSEIMYHPPAPELTAEFIELLNISTTESIELTQVRFTDGIDYQFPVGTILAAGERIVVSGSEFLNSTRLSNGGEQIILVAADGAPIRTFRYDDRSPWPEMADGNGFSLVLIDPASNPDHTTPENWRRSAAVGGAPGESDVVTLAGDPNADEDGDGMSALLEHLFGSSDSVGGRCPLTIDLLADHSLSIEFPRNAGAEDVLVSFETSLDLITWHGEVAYLVGITLAPDPVERWRIEPRLEGHRFLRIRVDQ